VLSKANADLTGMHVDVEFMQVGDSILVTSTDYNAEAEAFKIEAIGDDGRTITLSQALLRPHTARLWRDPAGRHSVDMRARVVNVESNVAIDSDDGPEQWANRNTTAGEKFGAHVLVADRGVAQLSNVAVRHCGHYGDDRGCLKFQGRAGVSGVPGSNVTSCATSNGVLLTLFDFCKSGAGSSSRSSFRDQCPPVFPSPSATLQLFSKYAQLVLIALSRSYVLIALSRGGCGHCHACCNMAMRCL
jgi:hypothetical protein